MALRHSIHTHLLGTWVCRWWGRKRILFFSFLCAADPIPSDKRKGHTHNQNCKLFPIHKFPLMWLENARLLSNMLDVTQVYRPRSPRQVRRFDGQSTLANHFVRPKVAGRFVFRPQHHSTNPQHPKHSNHNWRSCNQLGLVSLPYTLTWDFQNVANEKTVNWNGFPKCEILVYNGQPAKR